MKATIIITDKPSRTNPRAVDISVHFDPPDLDIGGTPASQLVVDFLEWVTPIMSKSK